MDNFLEEFKKLKEKVEELEKRELDVFQYSKDTFEIDGNGDLIPKYGDSLFEFDIAGNLKPIEGTGTDPYYELDANNDIMPKP